MDLVRRQPMRLTMDALGCFFIWRFDQAKDRAGTFVQPVLHVLDAVFFLCFEVFLVGSGHAFTRRAVQLRDCFLKTLWDTDATDFTELHGKKP